MIWQYYLFIYLAIGLILYLLFMYFEIRGGLGYSRADVVSYLLVFTLLWPLVIFMIVCFIISGRTGRSDWWFKFTRFWNKFKRPWDKFWNEPVFKDGGDSDG